MDRHLSVAAGFDRMFFICHSPDGRVEAGERRDVHVRAGRDLAVRAMDAGLVEWLLERAVSLKMSIDDRPRLSTLAYQIPNASLTAAAKNSCAVSGNANRRQGGTFMSTTGLSTQRSNSYRWMQLILGVVCMCMIANMQYGWTFFVNPMQEKHGWDRAAIQVAFTIFVVTETWLVPLEGWFVDKYGPKIVTLLGGLLCGIAWVINAYSTTLPMLYLGAAIGGTGAGAVYGTCVGNSLKWFPDRRGFAAGITAMGFGAGSALTVVPIQAVIKSYGYESAFLWFGIGQGIIVMLVALFLTSPARGDVPVVTKVSQAKRDFTPGEMVKTPVFWVMYAMFVMMAAGGLMATAQLGPIAKDFKIADVPVSLIGITLPALTFAATIDRVLNGVTRPFFGWISDHIGRENTMFIAFAIEGVGIWLLSQYGQNPLMFVILTGLVFFAWGEIYSLFPATCGDTFGSKYAATNAGLLYTAKGTAALIVPYTSVITTMTGSWHAVFLSAAALNIVAALMAMFVLKPMRSAYAKEPQPQMRAAPAE